MAVSKAESLTLLALAFLALAVLMVSATGKQDFGDECSKTAQITNLVSNDNPEACNTDKGLTCSPVSSKCVCLPGRAYEKGILGGIFGGGGCVGAANSPCLGGQDSSAKCVSNAQCGTGAVSLCTCSEGYHATSEGHCSNGSGHLTASGMTPLYIVGLILTYVFVQQ